MPFRPNYRQQRGERDRAKQTKKQEKLRKRDEETAARRKTEPDADCGDAAATGPEPAPESGEE